MVRINDFVFFLKFKKPAIYFSNLLAHRFQRYGTFQDVVKREDFKGLLGMKKVVLSMNSWVLIINFVEFFSRR